MVMIGNRPCVYEASAQQRCSVETWLTVCPDPFDEQIGRKLYGNIGRIQDCESNRVLEACELEVGFQARYLRIAEICLVKEPADTHVRLERSARLGSNVHLREEVKQHSHSSDQEVN